MRYTIVGKELSAINLAPATEAEEITQNILVILGSIEGTIPLARGLGLDRDLMHAPLEAIPALMASDIVGKIQTYEPRAELINIEFEEDNESGTLIPTLEVEF